MMEMMMTYQKPPSIQIPFLDGGDHQQAAGDLDHIDYSSDSFRMYGFKIRPCTLLRAHDWTDCPFAHPGEKARRRDPRRHHYSGVPCPDFRKGHCRRGNSCEMAHGVFECWLHPMRYRTQPCKDGTACRRRVCFFAHTPAQLRAPPPLPQSPRTPLELSYDGSPLRHRKQRVVEGMSELVASMRAMSLRRPAEEADEERDVDVGWVSELVM